MSEPSRPGVLSGIFAVLAPLLVLAEAVIASQRSSLTMELVLEPDRAVAFVTSYAAVQALMLGLGVLVIRQQTRTQRFTIGRARLLWLGALVMVRAFSNLVLLAVLARPETLRSVESGFGLGVPDGLQYVLYPAIGLSGAGGLSVYAFSIAAWWLIPERLRKRIWIVVDVVLIGAMIAAVALLPTSPPESAPDALARPVARHVITMLFVLRLMVHLVPPALRMVERWGLQPLVAARHLSSRKSGFLTAISLLSVGAVTLSCVALTLTLSVMGGFRNDLKRKILGNNAHIVIDRDNGHITGWRPMLAAVDSVPDVSGAAPYASGEVMLSSASNLATGVLRGIDPERIGKVNDLPRNLTSGKLEYLTHPEKLLELPADRTRDAPTLLGPSKLERVDDDAKPEAGAAKPDAGATAATQAAPDAKPAAKPDTALPGTAAPKDINTKAELNRKLAALDAFLRDAAQPTADATPKDRELLPGIIIGQELARALRLYVGDEVNVVAPLGALGPSGPMPKARPFRVAGIFFSGMYEYDMKFTYVALQTAQKFLGQDDAISGIEVRVSDIENAPTAAAAIRGKLGKTLRTRDWQELNSRLFGALALEKLAMFVALGIAILVASFCIAGTLTLMVQEKGREVAILKAMGTSDRSVVGVFVLEGGLIGLLGAALGLFFGYMGCFAAEHFGIRMNPEVYYIDRLPVHVDVTEFALTGLAAVLVCLVITVYPALLASRLRPVDALRYE